MLRALITFDHCVKNQANTWFPVAGFKVSQLAASSAKGIVVDTYGALTSPLGVALPDAARWVLDLTEFTSPTADRLILAMTARHRASGSTGVLYSIASLTDVSDAADLLTFEDLPSTNENRSTYVEIEINLQTGIAKVYLDTIEAKTLTLVNPLLSGLKSGKLVLVGTAASGNSTGVCATGDIYLVDSVIGDGYSNRFGKRLVAPLGVDVVTAEGWSTPSGKTALQTLQEPVSASATDVITSPMGLSFDPVQVSLSTAKFPDHTNVPALSLRFSGKVSNVSRRLSTSLTQRGITRGSKTHEMTTNLKYGYQIGIIIDSPDGGSWDTARLDDTTVTVSG